MKTLIFLILVANTAIAKKTPLMTFTWSCGEDGKKEETCLHGKHPQNENVVLLEYLSSKTCGGKTLNSFKYSDEAISNIDMTRLEIEKDCTIQSNHFAAVIGKKTVKYSWLPLTVDKTLPALSTFQQKIIDKKIKSGIVAAKKNSENRELYFKGGDPTYKLKTSSSVADTPFKFLEYDFTLKNQTPMSNGPFFMLTGEKVLDMTWFCSSLKGFFSVDGKIYATYSDTCCECGWHNDYISEIKKDKIQVIYGTIDFST